MKRNKDLYSLYKTALRIVSKPSQSYRIKSSNMDI